MNGQNVAKKFELMAAFVAALIVSGTNAQAHQIVDMAWRTAHW